MSPTVCASGLEAWLTDAKNAKTLHGELDAGLADFRELMNSMTDAPAGRVGAVRNACVHYLEGTRYLHLYATTPRPSTGDLFDWIQLRTDAAAELRACVRELELGVIDTMLVQKQAELRRHRKADNPFTQMAQALTAQLEEQSQRTSGTPALPAADGAHPAQAPEQREKATKMLFAELLPQAGPCVRHALLGTV